MTVIRAMAWCRSQRIGAWKQSEELEAQIAEVRADVGRLHENIRKLKRMMNETPLVGHSNALIGLYRTQLAYKQYLAELEGIYKRTVAVEHSGKIGGDDEPWDLTKLTDEGLDELKRIQQKLLA